MEGTDVFYMTYFNTSETTLQACTAVDITNSNYSPVVDAFQKNLEAIQCFLEAEQYEEKWQGFQGFLSHLWKRNSTEHSSFELPVQGPPLTLFKWFWE